MSTVLDEISEAKRAHVAARRRDRPLAEVERAARVAPPPRGFRARLEATAAQGRPALIAEIKKASPSKGLIRADFDPPRLARAFEAGGATCLSVLTDPPYFQGEDAYLTAAREAVGLPVLRKDFMVDPYQVAEARALGADCILLIMAALADGPAAEMEAEAEAWAMDVLVEVHDGEELDRALRLNSRLVGVNNRNLQTLAVDLATSETLAARMPNAAFRVSESGLDGPQDLARMARAGYRGFLVGESLMRQTDVAAATRALLAPPAGERALEVNS